MSEWQSDWRANVFYSHTNNSVLSYRTLNQPNKSTFFSLSPQSFNYRDLLLCASGDNLFSTPHAGRPQPGRQLVRILRSWWSRDVRPDSRWSEVHTQWPGNHHLFRFLPLLPSSPCLLEGDTQKDPCCWLQHGSNVSEEDSTVRCSFKFVTDYAD